MRRERPDKLNLEYDDIVEQSLIDGGARLPLANQLEVIRTNSMTLAIGLILLFGIIYLANVIESSGTATARRAFNWVLLLLNLPLFLLGLALLLIPPDQLQAADLGMNLSVFRPAGLALLLTAIWGLLATLPEARRLYARMIPIDPHSPVHTLALILAGYLIGNSVLTLTQGGLEGLAETSTAASLVEVVASEMLYAAVGIAGVGLFVRRDGWKILSRLALEKPTARQLWHGLRWVGLLLVLQWLTGLLFLLLDPEQAEILEDLNSLLLSNMDTVGEWFILALAAGVGEEILFRGALQPVFGLWVTSFIFALAHIQYGFTPATILVFGIGIVLGLVRDRYNTTTAIWVHFVYNFALGMLTLLAPYLESAAT
ncbi:MAG: CPBP family intramembrane glutamic endopeptidase [Chloroflexota bacterium]